MTDNLKRAIGVLKYLSESIKIGGGKSLIYTRDAEAIDTVVAELEKPTYTAEDMEDFRNWAHWNGYHFILSEKKWYNPFSEENAETRYTIDEVIKLWEESK